VRGWEQRYVSEFNWWKFVALANEALRAKRPTLFITEFATSVAHAFPGVFLSVPAFRPSNPEVRPAAAAAAAACDVLACSAASNRTPCCFSEKVVSKPRSLAARHTSRQNGSKQQRQQVLFLLWAAFALGAAAMA
jgi:hypothetical protein